MQETSRTQARSSSQEDPLEEEIEIHSSTLAQKIPQTEEPCGLQSMGSQRVKYKESEQRVSTKSLSILRADRVSPTARYRNESFKSLIGMYSTVPSLEMYYSVFNFMFHLMNIFKLSFLYLTEIHQKFIHYDCWCQRYVTNYQCMHAC